MQIDYKKLKAALIAAAEAYQKERTDQMSQGPAGLFHTYPKAGLYHGQKGMIRLQRLNSHLEVLSDRNEVDLLALTLGILQTDSNDLKAKVLHELIPEKYEITTIPGQGIIIQSTLTDGVFQKADLTEAAENNNAVTSISEVQGIAEIIKSKAVQWLIQKAVSDLVNNASTSDSDNNEAGLTQAQFDEKVRDYMAHLNGASINISYEMVPLSAAAHQPAAQPQLAS